MEQEYALPITEFDERGFRRKEALSARATYAAAALGLACGLVSSLVLALIGEWRAAVLVVGAGLAAIRPLFVRLGVMEAEDKKGLVGNAFLVLTTWLAVVILTSNPPFAPA